MPKKKNEESDKQLLSQLIARESLQDEPSDKATEICSLLVDLSTDYDSTDGAQAAIRFIDELIENEPDSDLLARLYYIQGNAWLVLDDCTATEVEGKWAWGREFLERAILSFRRSHREDGFSSFDKAQQSSVLTNLANQFDVAGRFIRSSQVYNEACSCKSGNGMPLLNRGISFWHYARQHYDKGHSYALAWHAHSDILASLEMKLEPHASKPAKQILKNIRAAVDPKFLDHDLEFSEYLLGDDEEESAYRQWCLSNKLFLNSLNDCCTDSVAARDIMHLPSLPVNSKFGLGLHGFFNQMKQEYVSGRYFLFEALHNDRTHFSDRDVMLYNTLDYPVLGLFAEKARWAFRSAASVLDKVAVFLAKYLNLSKRDKIDFRIVWYQKGDPKFGLRPCFASRKNWPWRGLFWLSKDLYKVSLCGEDLDPDSTQMRSIRNGLEHRYVKILEYGELPTSMEPFKDDLAEAYSRTEFLEMALRYLCYAREAIIYLALGIEADQRASRSSNQGLVLPIPLDLIDDESKF